MDNRTHPSPAFGESQPTTFTAEQIRQRLGYSTCAFPGDEPFGARHIAMIREAGIQRVEICGLHPPTHYDYHDAAQVAEIKAACQKQGVSIVAVHGPGVPYDSRYESVRVAALREGLASARVAQELGASIFVAHFNANERSERTVCEMLEDLEGGDIKLAVENGKDLTDFCGFVDRIGSDRFGMVVDIGHTRDPDGVNPFIKSGRAYEAMASGGHRLFHLHLHDFASSDHYPPFDGTIQWGEIFLALQDTAYAGEFMFEIAGRGSIDDTLQKTVAFPNEFVRRYGG